MLNSKVFITPLIVVLCIGLLTILIRRPEYIYSNASVTLKVTPPVMQQPLDNIPSNLTQEVNDLLAIVYALEHFKLDNGAYPISSQNGLGWDAVTSAYGESRDDWIKGLTPKYIKKLPRDPRMLNDGTRQYFYISNGAHYKLIVARSVNCAVVHASSPSLVDPVRHCSAYGFWTSKAAKW